MTNEQVMEYRRALQAERERWMDAAEDEYGLGFVCADIRAKTLGLALEMFECVIEGKTLMEVKKDGTEDSGSRERGV